MNTLVRIVCALILLVVGWLAYELCGPILRALPLQARSSSFPWVEGEVVSATVHEYRRYREHGRYAVIETAYIVDGRALRTTHIRFRPRGVNVSAVDPAILLKRYPVGTHVRVYYDPTSPRTAALIPGYDGAALGALAVIVPFSVIWFVLAGLLLRATASSESTAAEPEHQPFVRVSYDGMRKRYHTAPSAGMGVFGGIVSGMLAAACVSGICSGVVVDAGLGFAAVVVAVFVSVAGRLAYVAYRDDRSGRWDIVLDRGNKRLRLPPLGTFAETREIDSRDVARISRVEQGSDPVVLLHLRDGRSVIATKYVTKQGAQELEAMLREDLAASLDPDAPASRGA